MSIGFIGRKVGMTQVFQAGRHDGCRLGRPGHRTEHRDPPPDRRARRLHRRPARRRTSARSSPSPRPASSRTCPQVRDDPRVPASTTSTTTRSARQLDVGDLFAEGELVDVTGVSKGKGFAGHIKRHHFHARSQDPRLRPPPRAGLDRPGHDARSRLQGPARWPATWATSGSRSRSCASSAPTPSGTCCSSRGRCPARRGALILVKKA